MLHDNHDEILGTDYVYRIDTSYGLSKDGYIATGTESIVYKGLKLSHDGKIRLSCVLKFKYKSVKMGTEDNTYTSVDVLDRFKNNDLKIFDDLQECRSVVRIYDVIEDLGSFVQEDTHVPAGKPSISITGSKFFCVVEEFIDGWSLEEYCRDEYWKLSDEIDIGHSLKQKRLFKDFPETLKNEIISSYYNDYDEVIAYQREIIRFMLNLCEILEYVTDCKKILHLDIKPDNIMVTRHGKEIVLIDFGRSEYLDPDTASVKSRLGKADYNSDEKIARMFQYGTLGYAAPECFADPLNESVFPFDALGLQTGKMTVESDIFSFGATFWECLSIFDLCTQCRDFFKDKGAGGSYDYYRKNMLNDEAYCNRDLSLTSVHYHEKLENIIRKCTKKREPGYLESPAYYHSYSELERDITDALNSVPNIVRAENIKVKNSFNMVGKMLSVFTTFLILVFIFRISGFSIANKNWKLLKENYQSTKFSKLETISEDLIKMAPDSKLEKTYNEIADFTYKEDGEIDEQEAAMLIKLLQTVGKRFDNRSSIDDIMQYSNTRKFKEISKEIIKLDVTSECDGMILAEAIYKSEINSDTPEETYDTMMRYKDDLRFRNAVIKLKNVLDNDNSVKLVCERRDISKDELLVIFKEIESNS